MGPHISELRESEGGERDIEIFILKKQRQTEREREKERQRKRNCKETKMKNQLKMIMITQEQINVYIWRITYTKGYKKVFCILYEYEYV